MNPAIANKQLVVSKNIFFVFRVSKLRFLYKAATASGDVLGRSKKILKTNSAVFVQKTILLSFLVILQLKKKSHCIKYKEMLF